MKRSTTPTFLLELPLAVDAGQAKRLRAHFETARCLYNALLGEALKRLRTMRADAAWQEVRAIPQAHKQERREAFARIRQAYGFSEYSLMNFAKEANCAWIRDHTGATQASPAGSIKEFPVPTANSRPGGSPPDPTAISGLPSTLTKRKVEV